MTEGKFEFVYECHNLTKFLSFEQALSISRKISVYECLTK